MKQPRPLRRIDVVFYAFIVAIVIVAVSITLVYGYSATIYVDLAALSIFVTVAILRTFECAWQRWLDQPVRWVRKPLRARRVDVIAIGLLFIHVLVLCAILIMRVVSTYLPIEMIAWGVLQCLAYGIMVTDTPAGRWLREEAGSWGLVALPVATIPPKEYRVQD